MFELEHEDDNELNTNFQQLGYETPYCVANLGSLLFIIILQLALIPIIVLMALVLKCCPKVQRWSVKKMGGIFFNSILTFIDGTFLAIVLMAAINIKASAEGKVPYDASFTISVISLLVCVGELVAITVFLKLTHKRGKLRDKKSKKRCGYVYTNLNYKVWGGWALTYPVLYQVRFLILIYAVIYLQDYLDVQALLMSLSTIFVIAVVGMHHPFKNLKENYTQIASEAVILVITDLLLFSSDRRIEPDDKQYIGLTILIVLGAYLVWSQGTLLVSAIQQTYRKIKRCRARRAAQAKAKAASKTPKKNPDGQLAAARKET